MKSDQLKQITIGKLRGLQQCTSPRGTFTCLALDHRQNLRKSNPNFVNDAELSRFKLDVLSVLAKHSTAILLDPEVSAAQAVAKGVIPRQVGLVVAVESTGYRGTSIARQSQILPGWSVEKVKRMGASMVKLLVYYHPDSVSAPEVEKFVKKVVADCEHYDLGIMLEPLSYSLDFDKKLSSAEKNYVVIETARRLVTTGVDVLKVEFPLEISEEHDENNWRLACAKISSTSSAPWILLSAAVNFDVYLRQVEIACRAGASGIAVGRAVWQEAVHLDGKARLEFLRTTSRERLAKLAALCSDFGRPVNDFFRSDVPFDWYKKY